MALTAGSTSRQIVAEVAAPVTTLNGTTEAVRTITVGGLTPDMLVVVNWPSLDTGLLIGGAWCSAANTLKLKLFNQTGSPITPAAASLKVIAI